MGAYLVAAALTFDLGAFAAAHDWPLEVTTTAVVTLLWFAWLLTLCACFALLRRSDDGPDGDLEDPEPPWWPGFERDLRDRPHGAPRAPVA